MNMIHNLSKAYNVIKEYPIDTWYKLYKSKRLDFSMTNYNDWFVSNRVTESEIIAQKSNKFTFEPLISILVPLYNTPENFLRETIQCVINQSYTNWELCLADGSSDNFDLMSIINDCSENDKRIKYRKLNYNTGISGNTNVCLEMCCGDYIGLFDHDDLLEPDALFEYVKVLQDNKFDCLYCDEDLVSEDGSFYYGPNIKPDWSPNLFNAHNYITHFFVVKKSVVDQVGGFDPEFDGAQDYDFISRCVFKSKSIFHIPKVLYHWRAHLASTAGNSDSKKYAYDAGCRVVSRNVQSSLCETVVEKGITPGFQHINYYFSAEPKICVIGYNYGNDKEYYEKSLKSSLKYNNIDIKLVDASKNIYKEFNQIAKLSNSDFLFFWDLRLTPLDDQSFSRLLGNCLNNNTSAASGRMLYKNALNQFAGMVFDKLLMPRFIYRNAGKNNLCYMSRPLITCNYSSLILGCCIVNTEHFNMVDGFDEKFNSDICEIDFFLKLREKSKYLVYCGDSIWNSKKDIVKSKYNDAVELDKLKSLHEKYFVSGDIFFSKIFYDDQLNIY